MSSVLCGRFSAVPSTFLTLDELEELGVTRAQLVSGERRAVNALTAELKRRLQPVLAASRFDLMAPVYTFESPTKQGFHFVQ